MLNKITKKNIVFTKIQGRNGTVKEYINSSFHYEFSLFGIILFKTNAKTIE
jgi:hypothetical protein